MPTPIPAASMLNALGVGEDRLDDVRADEGQREEPQDDARDAGEDLEDRLDDAAHPRLGVLGEIDRAARGRSAPR